MKIAGRAGRLVEHVVRSHIDASPLPEVRVARVAHDREQLRLRVAAAKRAERAAGAQHRLLHDVFGVVRVAHEPAREVVPRRQVRQHRLLKPQSQQFIAHTMIQTPRALGLFPREFLAASRVYPAMKRITCLLIVLAAATCAAAANPATAPSTPPSSQPSTKPAGNEVVNDTFTFEPAVITISAGQSVTWINHDDVPHTATSTKKLFASPALDTDQRYTHTFTTAGEYEYYCAVHPHMTAKIIVK